MGRKATNFKRSFRCVKERSWHPRRRHKFGEGWNICPTNPSVVQFPMAIVHPGVQTGSSSLARVLRDHAARCSRPAETSKCRSLLLAAQTMAQWRLAVGARGYEFNRQHARFDIGVSSRWSCFASEGAASRLGHVLVNARSLRGFNR